MSVDCFKVEHEFYFVVRDFWQSNLLCISDDLDYAKKVLENIRRNIIGNYSLFIQAYDLNRNYKDKSIVPILIYHSKCIDGKVTEEVNDIKPFKKWVWKK